MIWDKWLGSRKTPEEKAAERVANIEARAKIDAAKAEAGKGKKRASIEKAIIAVTDRGFVTALAVACFVAYALDMIFFFQQTPIFWLSCLLCAFGFVIRTIAICGGVVLEWAEEDEAKEKPDPLDWKKARFVSALRWFGRRFSFSSARMTMRIMTWLCWLVCAYATVSFFGSGHEMRQFAQENITAMESTTVGSKDAQMDRLRTDKLDITKRYTDLINGARQSMNLVLDDGNKSNDDVSGYEKNIKAYEEAMTTELAKKDGAIEALEQGKETAQVGAQEKKAENPPFLAVYVFLADLTGWTTDGWTVWSALLFSIVFELIVDTGLKNYFRLKKRFTARLRTIEMRQVLEDAEWELNHFNTIQTANLAKLRAQGLAAEAQAKQDREIAELNLRTEREMAETTLQLERERARIDAARQGIPWIDPAIELAARQKQAEAEAAMAARKREAEFDLAMAEIEKGIREAAAAAELARNPPPAPPPPPPPPEDLEDWRLKIGPDGLNHYQRMAKKSQESREFDKRNADNVIKVKTEDWRNRFDLKVG